MGKSAYVLKNHESGRIRPLRASPDELPSGLEALGDEWHIWRSVCTFNGRRGKKTAVSAPACWVDLDPPVSPRGDEVAQWRETVSARLREFWPSPSLVVDSGRGFHAYWLLDPQLILQGEPGVYQAATLVAVNNELATALSGDHVGDLARVMRLPGTMNPKNGSFCRILDCSGVAYDLDELAEQVGVEPGSAPHSDFVPHCLKPTPQDQPRGRGRPRKGVTVRALRTLPPWARRLVKGGAKAGGPRYLKPGSDELDRSRADLAAMGAMVRAGWPDERIVAAFCREDWRIGERFRGLWIDEGSGRAWDYLERSIWTTRQGDRGEVVAF